MSSLMSQGMVGFRGALTVKKKVPGAPAVIVHRSPDCNELVRPHNLTVRDLMCEAWPHTHLAPWLRAFKTKNWPLIRQHLEKRAMAYDHGIATFVGDLWLRHFGKDGVYDYGLASCRLVTTAWVAEVVNALDESAATSFGAYQFHGIGIGTTAAANTDTDVETELTTEYVVNNTRAEGTDTQPSANVYETVATNVLDSGTPAITEQAVLNNAAVGSGTVMDRHTFGIVTVDGTASESLETTYQLTVAAET